jgi:hypothetical protein
MPANEDQPFVSQSPQSCDDGQNADRAADDDSDLDDIDVALLADDADWDVFIPDDDECDPLPEIGDFWFEANE